MSTVVSKNVQIGADGTASNNFTAYQPSTPDGTLRIGNGNSGSVTDAIVLNSSGVVSFTNNPTLSAGTANGVAYLNGSKVLTSGSALTFSQSGGTFSTTFNINSLLGAATYKGGVVITEDDAAFTLYGGSGYKLLETQGYSTPSSLKFYASNAEAMRLTSTGLGIGTSPAYKLHVSNYMGLGTQASSGSGAGINMIPSSTLTNWFVGSNYVNPGAFEIIPSTAGGGSTFSTPALVLNSSGNLGLGVTPSAWGSFIPRAIELPNGVGFASQSNAPVGHFSANAYYDGSWRYKANGVAARYSLGSDTHAWFTAPSGTAGNAISFTQAMTLDADGDLGIGVTSPARKLSVSSGSTSATYIQLCNTTSGTGVGQGFELFSDGTNAGVINRQNGYLEFDTNNIERLRIDSAGNVGIGTSSSTQKLEVSNGAAQFNGGSIDGTLGDAILFGSSAYPTVQKNRIRSSIGAGTAGANLLVFEASTETAGINSTNQLVLAGTGRIGFQNDAMTLDASGSLLVGTTSATPAGITAHKIVVERSSTVYGVAVGYSIDSAPRTQMSFYNSNGVVGIISTSGSATTYATSSDYRLKEDWVAVADASTRVNALKPVNFAWKVDGKRVDGFLAHELAEIVPEAVTGEKDAVDAEGKPVYQGIDQSKLVPLLTAALQEALARIESLEADVATLKGTA